MKVYDLMKMAGSFIELIGNYSSLFSKLLWFVDSNKYCRIWTCPDDCTTQSVWKTHVSVQITIFPAFIFHIFGGFVFHIQLVLMPLFCSSISQHLQNPLLITLGNYNMFAQISGSLGGWAKSCIDAKTAIKITLAGIKKSILRARLAGNSEFAKLKVINKFFCFF